MPSRTPMGKCTVLKKVVASLLRRLGARRIVPPLSLSVHPWDTLGLVTGSN